VEDEWNSVFKVILGVPRLQSAWGLCQRIPLILDGRHAPPGAAPQSRYRISEDPEPVINQHTDACFVLSSQLPDFSVAIAVPVQMAARREEYAARSRTNGDRAESLPSRERRGGT